MKKFLVVLLACVMIFGFATTALAADTQIKEFSDIADQSQAAKNAIMKLAVLGVIEGNEGIGGAYRPADNLTRAEFAKIVCYLTDNVKLAESLASVGTKFSDVSTGNWYTGWVNAAAQSGYYVGDPGGTFRPNANITMQEVATVALRAAGYTDKLPGNWPANYVTKAMNVGLLDDVTFVGSSAATRSDMAVICEAVLGINMVVHISNDIAYALALSTGDVDPDGFSEVYYITNETGGMKREETILHKAFKGEYYDLQVAPGTANGSIDTNAANLAVSYDGTSYYYYAGYDGETITYDETIGWRHDDFSSGELSLGVLNSDLWRNDSSYNKTFDEPLEDSNGNHRSYTKGDELASTYYITRSVDLTELAGMQVQITVIDNKEICFVDVVSSYVYGDSIHLDRANNNTSTQNVMIDGKSYRPSATMDMNGRVGDITDYTAGFGTNTTESTINGTVYNNIYSPIQFLSNSNNDDDFNGKVYLDKDGRIYAVKNYAAYDATPFGIFDDIDSSRVNWKDAYLSADDNLKIETGKNYTLYKNGESIKAEDLEENDLVSYLGRNGAPFYLATSPVEGELTAHNRYNNKLTLGGTAYAVIVPSNFRYSDDGGETFNVINLNNYEVDFGEAEFAKVYNFAKAGYVSGNLSNQRVIGVVTKIEPAQVWNANSTSREDRFEEITIYNAEGKEVTYKFTSNFRDAYNYHVEQELVGRLFKHGTAGQLDWNDVKNAGAGMPGGRPELGEELSVIAKGDIIQLALDKNDNVKRVTNYASYDVDPFNVRVTTSNSRITLAGGTYTLNKDAVVFNVAADNTGAYDDVSIQSVASVLSKDFQATKAVAFDVKTGANVNVLYIIGDISVYQFGILTGWGRDDGGDYWTINGEKVYASTSTRPDRYTVVSYIMSGGEATLRPVDNTVYNSPYLATAAGYYRGVGTLIDAMNRENVNVSVGVAESYRSANGALQIGVNNPDYVYIKSDTYIYDLVDEKVRDAADLITSPGRRTVMAFYDRDGNAEFVAVIGTAGITAPGVGAEVPADALAEAVAAVGTAFNIPFSIHQNGGAANDAAVIAELEAQIDTILAALSNNSTTRSAVTGTGTAFSVTLSNGDETPVPVAITVTLLQLSTGKDLVNVAGFSITNLGVQTGVDSTNAITGNVTLPTGTTVLTTAMLGVSDNATATFHAFGHGGTGAAQIALSTGATPVYVKLTAEDGSAKYYTLTITVVDSTGDVTITNVLGAACTGGGGGTGSTVDPLYQAIAVPYSKGVFNADEVATTETGATVTIYSNSSFGATVPSVTLAEDGSTVLYFTVTSTDGTASAAYRITATRAAANGVATLSNLQYKIGNGALVAVPAFAANTEDYDITLPYGTAQNAAITLTGTKTNALAEITVNNGVTLVNGEGTATITVTAEDGTTKTYSLDFDIAEPAATAVINIALIPAATLNATAGYDVGNLVLTLVDTEGNSITGVRVKDLANLELDYVTTDLPALGGALYLDGTIVQNINATATTDNGKKIVLTGEYGNVEITVTITFTAVV